MPAPYGGQQQTRCRCFVISLRDRPCHPVVAPDATGDKPDTFSEASSLWLQKTLARLRHAKTGRRILGTQ